MYKTELVGPTFVEAEAELVNAVDDILTGNIDADDARSTARLEILKAAGVLGMVGAYANLSDQTVQDNGYPIEHPSSTPDEISGTARWHTDFRNGRGQRPMAFYSPPGSKATEFAVASSVSFGAAWGKRILPRDGLWRMNIYSDGPSLPLNWFEIVTGSSTGTDDENEAIDRFGVKVREGRIVTAPIGYIATGDGRSLMHRTPRYDTSDAGKRRLLVVARPRLI